MKHTIKPCICTDITEFAVIENEENCKRKPIRLEKIEIEEIETSNKSHPKKQEQQEPIKWSPLKKEDIQSFSSDLKKQVLIEHIRSIVITILFALIIVLTGSRFCFILTVPSSSMEPTMNPKEQFFATKIMSKNLDYGIYGFYSEELDMRLVKRLVGKPGDKIELKEGKLIRNGEELEEDYVLYDSYFSGTYEVPENKYLFLGDNRANSIDARFWKNPYIDRSDIIGKVLFRIHPYFRTGSVA